MKEVTAQQFQLAMDDMANTMLDELAKTGDFPEKYEYITVSWGGLTFKTPMHADNFDNLETFVKRSLEDK